MAASSGENISTRDLSKLPDISVTFVEDFIKGNGTSSGKEQMAKGFKYYSEEYVHSVSVYPDEGGSLVKGKCFRSQRKNESPHEMKILINKEKVENAFCTCTIGQSGYCGHVTALLYQLAHYKKMKLEIIPTDVAKTSLPQTWHIPRGPKLHGDKADNIVVQGYDRENPQRATKGIKSTLYNPISGEESLNICSLVDQMKDMDILFSTVAMENYTDLVQTQFGKFQKGCVLSYQQKMSSDYILNLMENNTFPDLPSKNVMVCNVNIVLSEKQMQQLISLKVTQLHSIEIEQSTRLQTADPKWHKIRKERITASNAGEIVKRRADGSKLNVCRQHAEYKQQQ